MGINEQAVGPGPWIRGAVVALGGSLGVIIIFGGALYSDLREDSTASYERCSQRINDIIKRKSELRQRVDVAARELSRIAEHVAGHDITSEHWIRTIQDNGSRINDLSSNSKSRPDPFTGTEGRKLERRLDRLELTQETVNHFIGEVGTLRQSWIKVQDYYRQQVLPLIQQSNALQLQRINEGGK